MNFGINTNFGMSSNFSVSVSTSSVVTSNMQNTMQTQHTEKMRGMELRINQSQTQVHDLNKRLRNGERKFAESQRRWQEEKQNMEFHLSRIRGERNEKRAEVKKLEDEIIRLKGMLANNGETLNDYNTRLQVLQDKVNRTEEEQRRKAEKMAELENELLQKENEIEEEEGDDIAFEEIIQRQKDTIKNMSVQINQMIRENQQDDFRQQQYELTIKQKDEEISLLKRQLEELKNTYLNTEMIEISQIETTEIYIEIENRYNISVAEKQGFQTQLDIKNKLIRDLELKVKAGSEKCKILFNTINDLKAHMDSYENRELEYKRSIDEQLMKLSQINTQFTIKISRVTSLEGLLKAKDTKIRKLQVWVRERDRKISEMKGNSVNMQAALNELREQLQVKIAEINEWNKENERDDAQIENLLVVIEKQNEAVKGWEAENKKDDARIEELEGQVTDLEGKISKLVEFFNLIKERFGFFNNMTGEFTIVDESMTSESMNLFKQQVTQSTEYLSLQERMNITESSLNNMLGEVNSYRNEVEKTIGEKNGYLAEIDNLKNEVAMLNKKIDVTNGLNVDYQKKMETSFSQFETNQTCFVTANDRVTSYKSDYGAKADELSTLFVEIEEFLG